MTGFVYFIAPEAVMVREEDLRIVKIGFTKSNPMARLRDLQCGSPVVLELLGFIDGDVRLERAFHAAFAPVRSHGEWFFIDGKLGDFLSYFDERPMPEAERYIPHDRVIVSAFDNIFAECAPHPSWSDERYLATAVPYHLATWFTEAVH